MTRGFVLATGSVVTLFLACVSVYHFGRTTTMSARDVNQDDMRTLGIPEGVYSQSQPPKIAVVTVTYTPFRMALAFVLAALPLAVILWCVDQAMSNGRKAAPDTNSSADT